MAEQLEIKVVAKADDSQSAKDKLQNSIQSLAKNLEIPAVKIIKFDISESAKQIKNDLERQLKDVKINASFVQATSGGTDATKDIGQSNSAITQLEKRLQNLRLKIDTSEFKKQIETLEIKLKGLSVTPEIQQSFDSLIQKFQNLQTMDFSKLTTQESVNKIKEFEVELTKVNNQTKILSQQQAFPNQEQQLKRLTNQLIEYGKANSKLFSSPVIKEQYDDLINSLKNSSISSDQAKGKILELKNAVNEAGLASKSFSDRLKEAFSRFGIYASLAAVVSATVRTLKQMATEVIAIDDAMTELRKVTDLSEQSYAKFLDTAKKGSAEIGATISDFVKSTADFARLGYSLSEAEGLAKAAVVYKNVGDGIRDIDEATTSVISTMKGFSLESSMAMDIVDKFNKVKLLAS